MDAAWVAGLATSPWLVPALFALVVGDAFLVVLPSETAVVALGALWATEGAPPLLAIVLAAAAGAVVGDGLCYLIGRRIGLDRWRWQREGEASPWYPNMRLFRQEVAGNWSGVMAGMAAELDKLLPAP